MKFAHSLGYPHYELMLDDLSQRQFLDLLRFFNKSTGQSEELKAQVNDIKVAEFLKTKMRRQQKNLRAVK